MKIRKDWSHPDFWSSKTLGPRLMVVSWWMVKWGHLSSLQKQMIQGLLFGGEVFPPNQLKRGKKKKETDIFYCAFCSLELKILYYFKLIIWTLKISDLFFVVEEWLHPLQQNLPRQPRPYARRNILPYPSSFYSFLHFLQQLVISTLHFSSLRINLLSQRNPEW